MQVEVNGTRLWFDVDGPLFVPAGSRMATRPTIVFVHGGPGGYDHSYFKPHFDPLKRDAQLVFLDLRDHGRSARHDVEDWSLEVCADDLRAFCDALGIERPIVLGHSMGGMIALSYAVRHPGHAGALVQLSSMARFDLERLAEGFRRIGGDEVAELARRDFGGEPVSDDESARVFAAFGPTIPSPDELARRKGNPALGVPGMAKLRAFDVVAGLAAIGCPTLVCVGELDPVTPVAAATEIVESLPPGLGRLEVIEGAGHFPWLDAPDRVLDAIRQFAVSVDHHNQEAAVRPG